MNGFWLGGWLGGLFGTWLGYVLRPVRLPWTPPPPETRPAPRGRGDGRERGRGTGRARSRQPEDEPEGFSRSAQVPPGPKPLPRRGQLLALLVALRGAGEADPATAYAAELGEPDAEETLGETLRFRAPAAGAALLQGAEAAVRAAGEKQRKRLWPAESAAVELL